MKTIEIDVRIADDNLLHVPLSGAETLQPGMYHVVVIIEEQPVQATRKPSKEPLELNMLELEGWPSDCTFRREDIYGDDGR
jgi:hypothetical protein